MIDTLVISRYGSPDVRIERRGRRLRVVNAPPGVWWDLPALWRHHGAAIENMAAVWSDEAEAQGYFDASVKEAEERAMADARIRVRVVRHG